MEDLSLVGEMLRNYYILQNQFLLAPFIKFLQCVFPASEYLVLHHHNIFYTFQHPKNLFDYIELSLLNIPYAKLLVQKL